MKPSVLGLVLVGDLEVAARGRREVVAAAQERLPRLVVRRQRHRRQTGDAVDDVEGRIGIAEPRSVVAAAELQALVGVADRRLEEVGVVVDRVGQEVDAATGRGAEAPLAPEPRSLLLLVLIVHLQIEAGRQVLAKAEGPVLALRVEVVARGCRAVDGLVRAADPGETGGDGERDEIGDLVEVDEEPPVALLLDADAQRAIVEPDVAPVEPEPAGVIEALDEVEIEQPVPAFIGQAVELAEALVVLENVPRADRDLARRREEPGGRGFVRARGQRAEGGEHRRRCDRESTTVAGAQSHGVSPSARVSAGRTVRS